jgi:hypothetical protein
MHTVEDLARYLAGIVNKQKNLEAEQKRDKYHKGVVRAGNTVELNDGTIYPAKTDGVDDNFRPGEGVSVIFSNDGREVLVVGR